MRDDCRSHADFLPTILSLAGGNIPDESPGYDLTPLLMGQRDQIQESAISEIRWGTAIITERWKMSVYPRDGTGALYDRKEDPDELYNRYDAPAYKQVRKELTQELADGLIRLSVDGEPVSSVEAEGALPEQPGHERIAAGHVHVGHGPEWRTPIGQYDPDATFGGEIRCLTLHPETPGEEQ